jgi:hypothetical protein
MAPEPPAASSISYSVRTRSPSRASPTVISAATVVPRYGPDTLSSATFWSRRYAHSRWSIFGMGPAPKSITTKRKLSRTAITRPRTASVGRITGRSPGAGSVVAVTVRSPRGGACSSTGRLLWQPVAKHIIRTSGTKLRIGRRINENVRGNVKGQPSRSPNHLAIRHLAFGFVQPGVAPAGLCAYNARR